MTRYRACFVIFILGITLCITSPASANDYSYARVVRLSVVAGSVSIAHTGDQVWQPALANMPLQEGDTIASGAGRAEVEFENGAVAFLAENSILQFTQLALSAGGRLTQITLTQGTASFYGDLSSADAFAVLTSSLSVTLTGHAEFRVDSNANGGAVEVFQGNVEANSAAGVTQVRKGETLSVSAEDAEDSSTAQNRKADDFDRWVGQEDQAIAVGAADSLGYMNSAYAYGASDLYAYGSWMDCSSLGPCWQPYGMTAGWSPYMDGFWSPYASMGMTWISYEPWGWMPYHFGAWAASPDFGWVWVPGGMGAMDMWQPAMVSWVTVGNQVGWVPLSPFDKPGSLPYNLRNGVLVNPSSAGSPVVVERLNGASLGNGQTHVAQIGHPPSNFVSSSAPRSVAITSPFSAQGNRGLVFDHTSHSFVNGTSASMSRDNGMHSMSRPSSAFVNRPMGPPPGARQSVPSPRGTGGGGNAGGGMAGSPSVSGGSSAGPVHSGGSSPAAAPSGGGGSGASPHH
jgi:uncharacterized protein DUF6600/FecR-like protein